MTEIVMFRLSAPLAAFGDVAVGERRITHRRPGQAAVAGLVAAALGMSRSALGHEELAAGFHLVVRTDDLGVPLADFHTAQMPPQKRGRRYATRREELANKSDLNTIVSRRDYWSDAAFTLILWPTDRLAVSLDRLVEALRRPSFALYVGRRSCPLSAPLAPCRLGVETVVEAFTFFDRAEEALWRGADLACPYRAGQEIAIDARLFDIAGAGLTKMRRETRWDALENRARWQFGLREEWVTQLSADAGEA